MRKYITYGCGILLLLLGSCQDKEFDPPGSFISDGESHDLHKGYFSNWTRVSIGHDVFYEWSLVLASEGVSFNPENLNFTGEGNFVLMILAVRNNPATFPDGTYSFDGGNNGNFVTYGGVYIDFNIDSEQGTVFEKMKDARFQMKKAGENYALAFSLRLDDNRLVSGSYVGHLTNTDN